jgi:hypothetical protein
MLAMSNMRALIALGVLAVLSGALWLFYSSQPHPIGTLGYDYLLGYPAYLSLIVVIGVLLGVRALLRRNRPNR